MTTEKEISEVKETRRKWVDAYNRNAPAEVVLRYYIAYQQAMYQYMGIDTD